MKTTQQIKSTAHYRQGRDFHTICTGSAPLADIKVCTKCGEEKPLSKFHISKCGKYGYLSRCKICVNKRVKERNEQVQERLREYIARYDAMEPERLREQARKSKVRVLYKAKNLEKVRKQNKKAYALWFARNSEKVKSKDRRYRLKRRQSLCQGQPKNQRELLIMFRMLLTKTLKASKEQNLIALSSLRQKYEQFVTMVS